MSKFDKLHRLHDDALRKGTDALTKQQAVLSKTAADLSKTVAKIAADLDHLWTTFPNLPRRTLQ